MTLDCLKALEVQDALRVFVAGWVSLPGSFHVCHSSFQYALQVDAAFKC